MLNLIGDKVRLCDGITRRQMLRIGALGMGGLSLPSLLQAEQAAGVVRNIRKSVIMIYMCGAPAHQDMYDLNDGCPQRNPGEFRPIATNVSGIEICEHMPRLARIMTSAFPLRSVYGSPDGNHDSFICYTGRSFRNQPPGGWPAIGSIMSKLSGPAVSGIPPFLRALSERRHPPYCSPGHPDSLEFRTPHSARVVQPAKICSCPPGSFWTASAPGKDCWRVSIGTAASAMPAGQWRGSMTSIGRPSRFSTSNKLADALDVSKNRRMSASVTQGGRAELRGRGSSQPGAFPDRAAPGRAGARVVTLNFGRWDFPQRHLQRHAGHPPAAVRSGVVGLIEDLHAGDSTKMFAVVGLGGIRSNPEESTPTPSRSLAAGRGCITRGRRVPHGTGHRIDRPAGSRNRQPPSPLR